jgi:polysaccharide biosynthesis protein PslF
MRSRGLANSGDTTKQHLRGYTGIRTSGVESPDGVRWRSASAIQIGTPAFLRPNCCDGPVGVFATDVSASRHSVWLDRTHAPHAYVTFLVDRRSIVVLSVGFLSSYPPTQCGLATFTASLERGLIDSGTPVGVVRVRLDDHDPELLAGTTDADVVLGVDDGTATAADVLNRFDVTIVQHEFGVFGGRDGERVLEVAERLTNALITVLHTVLVAPTPHQRFIVEELGLKSDRLVVMTRAARQRLLRHYDVDEAKVIVIPHGANAVSRVLGPKVERPTLLTWGLLGPGKGIERVIGALAALRDQDPLPRYLVVGRTHPRVVEHEGERYRRSLEALAHDIGVSHMVEFVDEYLDAESMEGYLAHSDAVVLPYDSLDQITSGVLVEAVAAGKPVVATRFPHAVELLSTGAGIVVAHDDPLAMSEALFAALYDSEAATSMRRRAIALSGALLWPAVARRYIGEMDRLPVSATSAA